MAGLPEAVLEAIRQGRVVDAHDLVYEGAEAAWDKLCEAMVARGGWKPVAHWSGNEFDLLWAPAIATDEQIDSGSISFIEVIHFEAQPNSTFRLWSAEGGRAYDFADLADLLNELDRLEA